MAPILVVGSNSWCSVAEADSYFDEKYGASAWASLSMDDKERLLISAYRWINQQSFFSISASSTSGIVKQAQYEVAWFIYNYKADYDKRRALNASGVTSYRILDFSESLKDAGFPEFIKSMLDDFIIEVGGTFPRISRDLSNNASE